MSGDDLTGAAFGLTSHCLLIVIAFDLLIKRRRSYRLVQTRAEQSCAGLSEESGFRKVQWL